jgi:transposase
VKNNSMLTAGMDIGDRYSKVCVVDEVDGEVVVVEETKIRTKQADVERYFGSREPMTVAMEVGTHSPWMSRMIHECGHEVIVANARKLRFIFDNERKCDDADAEAIARVARMDRKMLHPLEHRPEVDAAAMALLRSREALVRTRTALINHVRGTVKSNGERMPGCAAYRFHKLGDALPGQLVSSLGPVMEAIESVNERIKELDLKIEQVSRESYPETELLRQVPGVGPIIALMFVLVIADPERFRHARSAGPYLGMVPRRDQSGDNDPQLRIAKTGNPYLRRLLVSAAHYILGPFGPDSDLQRHGLKIAERGGKRAKKRAAVAVGRKLAVLLLTLLKTGEDYEPLRQANRKVGVAA